VKPGSQGGGFFNDDLDMIARIEREVGPEAAEATRRSLRLARHPRALSDAERAEIRANLEPILRDMRSSGAIVPDVREEAHDDLGPEYVHAWIELPESTGAQGIRVQVSLPPPERLADLADQLQEWEIEELAAAGRAATWPECPPRVPGLRIHGGDDPVRGDPPGDPEHPGRVLLQVLAAGDLSPLPLEMPSCYRPSG
jgi:hypothetical protein